MLGWALQMVGIDTKSEETSKEPFWRRTLHPNTPFRTVWDVVQVSTCAFWNVRHGWHCVTGCHARHR